jgi:hypothetical protein
VIGPLNNNEAGYFENMKPELSDSSVAGRMTATTADYPGGEKLSPKTVSEEIKTPRIDVTAIMKPQQTVTSSYSHESDISPLCDELSGSSVSELASRSRHPGVVPGYEPGSRNEAVSYPAQELDAYPRRQDQGVDTIQELAEYPQYTRPYDAPEAVQQGMTHSTLDPTFDVQTSASQPGLEVVPQPTSTRALDGPQERRMSELLAEQQKIQEEVSRLKRLQALADEERRVQDEIQRYAGSGQRG